MGTDRLSIFVLVPAFVPTGPVKGAAALANALADRSDVSLVAIRGGDATLDVAPEVRRISLADHGRSSLTRLRYYRRLLGRAKHDGAAASISFCLSADLFNVFCRDLVLTVASVRGNLPANYQMDYGPAGWLLGHAHLLSLRGIDAVVAMNEPMATQVRRATGRSPDVIPNFIDERAIAPYRATSGDGNIARLVFLGSLSQRKRPIQLIEALADPRLPPGVTLDLIGGGPLFEACEKTIARHGLEGRARLHGQLTDPYPVLSNSDILVLPSLSEGTSRAMLEALHLGIPVVARDVDGNQELVEHGVNGALFRKDDEIFDAIRVALKVAAALPRGAKKPTLLPAKYRQADNAAAFIALIEERLQRTKESQSRGRDHDRDK